MKTIILITVSLTILAAATPIDRFIKFQENLPRLGIINGHEVEANSIPYQVLVLGGDSDGIISNICSGTLISQRYILTAARCVDGITAIQVAVGITMLSTPESTAIQLTLRSPEITVHENFHVGQDNKTVNDIAVVKIPGIFDISEAVQTVKLPSRADVNKDYVGEIARISGWGMISVDEESRVLMQADMQVISNEVCEKSVPDLVESSLCCAGINGTGACDEDFGGPLIVDDVQIGIISFVPEGCSTEKPTVFTRITSYLDWIESHTDVVIQ